MMGKEEKKRSGIINLHTVFILAVAAPSLWTWKLC